MTGLSVTGPSSMLIALLGLLYSCLSLAGSAWAQPLSCTAENTLDYRQAIRNSKNLVATTNACFVGNATSELEKDQAVLAKSRTCFTSDSLAYCAQSMAALAISTQFTAPFDALANELSQKTGKEIKPTGIMTAIVRNFDAFDQGKSDLVMTLDGYSVTFSARDVLYAHLAHSLRTKNASIAEQPVPRDAKDCFDASAGSLAKACRDLGRIIGGRALQGKETSLEDLEK